MKKGKRLSKADALRVLRRAYDLIKNDKVIIYHFTQKKMRNDIHLYETLYWVSPIPSTGCSRVRSPDSFTELNVFDFTYLTIFFSR